MKGSISVQEEETWTAPPAKERRAPERNGMGSGAREAKETIETRGDR